MKARLDSNSPAIAGRFTAHRSVWSGALSVLATGAAIFGAGPASAFPFSKIPEDVRLAG
ncbi:MAG: hypothetical protein QOK09_3611 [Mycobacterium sp.]|nr:hypothetical protein [Mycobacterium sp.]